MKNKWFITFAQNGGECEADGFFCQKCFNEFIAPEARSLQLSAIDPENANKYECEVCGIDHRDQRLTQTKAIKWALRLAENAKRK